MRICYYLLVIVTLFFTACAKEEVSELSFAVGGAPSELDYWEELIARFEKDTGTTVNLLRQPTDTDQRRQGLVIPLKAEEKDPDLFLMDVAWVAQFSASDWLLPLDSFIKKDKFPIEKMFQPVIDQVDKNRSGKIIALPVYLDCGMLYYRKDLLEKYNSAVPQTWEALTETALAIQERERKSNPRFHGYVWQGAQYEGLICNFVEFVYAQNGALENKGEIKVNTPENIRALSFMRDLIHKYKVSPPNTFTEMKEEEVRQIFQEGNALFERNWPYAWKLHQGEKSPVRGKGGMAILPRFEGGRHAATLGGWHLGISRFSDNKKQAWELLQFILSFETQKNLALSLGWNPGRKDIYDDPEIQKKIPQVLALKKSLENAVARPNVPYYTRISSILQKHVHSAIAGKEKPEQALLKAQKELDEAIRKYNE